LILQISGRFDGLSGCLEYENLPKTRPQLILRVRNVT
jgi:hypothetical protein